MARYLGSHAEIQQLNTRGFGTRNPIGVELPANAEEVLSEVVRNLVPNLGDE
jgi:hypothetical protein